MKILGQELDNEYRLICADGEYGYWILGRHWSNTESNRYRASLFIKDVYDRYGEPLDIDTIELEKCYMCPDKEDGDWRECRKDKKDRVKATKIILKEGK